MKKIEPFSSQALYNNVIIIIFNVAGYQLSIQIKLNNYLKSFKL